MIWLVRTSVSSILNTKSNRKYFHFHNEAEENCFLFRLEEDKRVLEKEKARIPNQNDIEEKMKNFRKECDEFRRQIAQKHSEITDHSILLTDKRKKFGVTSKQYEELTHTIENLEVLNSF